MAEPALILADPHPRRMADIFDAETLRALHDLGRVVVHDGGPMPAAMIDEHLPRASLLLGQTDLPRARLDRAASLRGVINVETNFLPNIDYETCFARGIHVLTPGSAFAPVVAEAALAMAIDLARGITQADRDFRAGTERYGLDGNAGSFVFTGCTVGLIGYGDLGRALHRLLLPFGCPTLVFDPWLPDYFLRAQGLTPAPLEVLLAQSRVVFVFAGVTTENQHFLGRAQFETMQPGAAFLLMSRAAVVDFPAMLEQARSGRLRVATDVFPQEPVAPDDPVRRIDGLLLSAHRAGGLPEALFDIGRQTVADAGLILRGLAPVVCRRAQRETVGRARSKPVDKT
jgi:phosphoglycerate dehydrogenase-like enzyme